MTFFRIDTMWESLARFYAAETKSGKCLVAVYKCKRKRKKKKIGLKFVWKLVSN